MKKVILSDSGYRPVHIVECFVCFTSLAETMPHTKNSYKSISLDIYHLNRLYYRGILGAEGRTRTVTGLPLLDFESSASTNSTTPALYLSSIYEITINACLTICLTRSTPLT